VPAQSIELSVRVNRRRQSLLVAPRETLADVLRDRLGLTGTKVGCDSQVCGSCSVLLDGAVVSACTVLALEAQGRELVTIEGLGENGKLDTVQAAFLETGALQCGFCTPGFILAVKALLAEQPQADPEQVRAYLRGNLCRCTGYGPILEAIRRLQEASA
jgi:carbon-monoxide dehydrogenase small subunit